MYKILFNILLSRLTPYAEEMIEDHQCGFRRNRITTDNIFCNRHIQGAAFNVTHFESRITHLLHTTINTTEHGQVSPCLGFT